LSRERGKLIMKVDPSVDAAVHLDAAGASARVPKANGRDRVPSRGLA
jgi:hypothetical protein